MVSGLQFVGVHEPRRSGEAQPRVTALGFAREKLIVADAPDPGQQAIMREEEKRLSCKRAGSGAAHTKRAVTGVRRVREVG